MFILALLSNKRPYRYRFREREREREREDFLDSLKSKLKLTHFTHSLTLRDTNSKKREKEEKER